MGITATNNITGASLSSNLGGKAFADGFDRILENSSRSWTEDYNQENGKYQSKCSTCRKLFIGNKHRVICKECSIQLEVS